jgi:hypothetical protein
MAFDDTNCDGVDGDLAKAVFVAPTGSDSNSGTLASPKKTINAAIIAASAASKDVYVDNGTYPESLSLVSGISIYGGYVGGTGARVADAPTIVRGAPAALASGAQHVALQLLTLEGQPDADGNAYGLRAISANGTRSRLLLDHVTAHGLAAAAGTAGTGGSQGASGYLGFGANGSGCNGGGGATGGPGGNGGGGGNSGNGSGYLGGPGTAGTSVGGATGGLRGRDTSFGNGGGGGTGDPGGTGANNPAHPVYDLATWVRPVGALGATGGTGAGGGGGIGGFGASSGFYDFCGGAGGGGGVGGGGGTAGSGGQAGGGSFGAYLFDASVVASASQFVAGTGGAGGNGGSGGSGGTGGSGGVGNYGSYVFSDFWPTAHSGDGGFGGNGGFGGKGGGGGAGAGGPAVGLLQASGGSGYAAQQGTTEAAGNAGTGGKQGNTGLVGAGGQSAGLLRSATAPSTSTADFDADGIADPADVCPGVAAPGSADGCLKRPAKLTDRDGDGVPDTVDACPDVVAGATDLDQDGCSDPSPHVDDSVAGSAGDTRESASGRQDGSAVPTRVTFKLPFTVARSTTTYTVLSSLRVTGLPSGSTLTATCAAPHRKRCPGATRLLKRSVSGVVSLNAWVKRKLPAGTRISVSVVNAEKVVGARKTLTVKKRARPSVISACLAPGSAKLIGC